MLIIDELSISSARLTVRRAGKGGAIFGQEHACNDGFLGVIGFGDEGFFAGEGDALLGGGERLVGGY